MPRVIRSVLIAGYGTMGRAVAKTFAGAGFETRVVSRRAAQLDDLPAGVCAFAILPPGAPDLVIEFLPEDLAMKLALFAQIEAAWGDADFLLATGTSGIDMAALAAPLRHPERLLAPRMCVSGLVQQKDLSGLVVNAASQRSIVPALFHNRTPNPMLQAADRLRRLLAFLDSGLGEDAPNTTPKSRSMTKGEG